MNGALRLNRRPHAGQRVLFMRHGGVPECHHAVADVFVNNAAESVLVAHNAAFDLKFIRMREHECGLRFDNPVLDTMLLSAYVDGTREGQSLDAIAERLGIRVTDRHTALGDAMATAAVLVKLIDGLEQRGIHTLDQAVKTLDITMELHQRQAAF